jgi:dTDP-4-amino-4,6-dideoxygalactose transaminase
MGEAGAFSFNYVKVITGGEGGMIITDHEDYYRRFFALHDHGHAPLRRGKEIGERPFVGLDFRMTELQGAILLAQLRRLGYIRERLHANKRRFKSLIGDVPGLEFRELPDPDGEAATLLTLILPSAEIARKLAQDLGSHVLAEAGWHVYANMEPILEQRLPVPRGCPFHCTETYSQAIRYEKGMLPRTDDLLARSINIGIGMYDRGLAATFGLTIQDGPEEVEARAAQFRQVAKRYLG